ncbi:MAG TPA: hypothetical protein PKO06_20065, partial [Candidatus Ozemobacteraceae bacterium]|nr:hypothetical protein [Candidatus Ozemobacteraceae bacterium]
MNKLLTFVVGILLLTTSLAMAAGSESTPPRDLETWRAASKEIYALLADGTVLNMQKKFVEATPLLRQALDKALESGIPSQIDRIRLELARALVETDQGAEAATLAETVYRRTPDSSMAALRYGQALLSVGRTHDAIGILKQ